MRYRRILPLSLFAIACDSPVAPLACDEPLPIYAIREHPMEYGICFDASSREALTYTAKSSDREVVTADISGGKLVVTGQSEGQARVTVVARGANGATGAVDYRVVARNAWNGGVTKCVLTPADEGTDYEIEYWLRANIDLVDVATRVTVGGVELGPIPSRDMTSGLEVRSYRRGRMAATPTSDACSVDIDYEIAG